VSRKGRAVSWVYHYLMMATGRRHLNFGELRCEMRRNSRKFARRFTTARPSRPRRKLAGGAVVRQQCEPDGTRRRFAWIAAGGYRAGIEVRGTQPGRERIDLETIVDERARVEDGQCVERGLGRAVRRARARAGRLVVELRIGAGAPGQRSGAARNVDDPRAGARSCSSPERCP
jgi:hypothetical protein